MVRKYQKKTDRVDISEEAIVQALNDYRNGNYRSIREAAEAHGLKKSTLHFRLSKITKKENKGHEPEDIDLEKEHEDLPQPVKSITVGDMAPVYNSKYSHRQVFTPEQETMIVDYCIERSKINYGLTYSMTRELAYKYAVALDLNERIPQKWHTTKSAGEEWMYHFMKRHPDLSLRQAENTSLSRNTSFNAHNIGIFFNNLNTVLAKVNPPPSRIVNLDESGISTVLEAPKVIAAKGTKQVGQVVSAERGEQLSFCAFICADGSYLPPVYIFPRKRPNFAYMIGSPEGSKDLYSSNGWMNGELFLETLKHIQVLKECSKSNPLVLILDNHESHVGLDVVMYCRDNGIHMLTFHPHTTHRMQPLDTSVFGPFKRRLAIQYNIWLAENPGHTITIREIPKLTKKPFIESFTETNIKSGFRKAGIHPLNRDIFNGEDFKGASVTDRPSTADNPDISVPSTSSSVKSTIPATDLIEISTKEDSGMAPLTPQQEKNKDNSSISLVSPQDVMPFPKYVPKTNQKPGRKKGRSRILTDTPEKDALLKQAKEKEEKRLLAEKRKSERAAQKENKRAKFEGISKKLFYNDSSDTEDDEPKYDDGGDSPEEFSEEEDDFVAPLKDQSFKINDFILTKFPTKKTVYHFIGQIEEQNEDGFSVKFLKKRENSLKFFFSDSPEVSIVDPTDILFKMRQPDITGGTSRATNCFVFKEDLSQYNFK